MLRGEEPKSERIRRGEVFCTQGTIATASLCRSGGEPGVREKKSAWGTTEREKGRSRPLPIFPRELSFYFEFPFANCTSPMIHLVCPPKFCISFLSSIFLGTTVIPSGYANVWGQIWCIMGDVQMATNSWTFLFGSLRGLKKLVLSTDSQLSIRPSSGIREEERGGQGTFAVSPFRSLLLQILILGWSTVSQSPYGGQSTRFELRSPNDATPQFLFRN